MPRPTKSRLEAPPTDLSIPYRVPVKQGEIRSIDQIPSEEIISAHRTVTGDQAAREVAGIFGIKRLTTAVQERIEAAIDGQP